MSRALLAAICLTALGCASVPLAPRPSGGELDLVAMAARSPKRAAIVGCNPVPPAGTEPCVVITRHVTEMLRDTGLFSRIGTSVSDADVTVQIHPVDDGPDEDAESVNPGYFVLSAFVPLWWADTYGYRLTARDRAGREVQVDTTRDGTEIMWGLAALLNVAPDRGFMPDLEREAAQVGVQLLPLWPEVAAAAASSRDAAPE